MLIFQTGEWKIFVSVWRGTHLMVVRGYFSLYAMGFRNYQGSTLSLLHTKFVLSLLWLISLTLNGKFDLKIKKEKIFWTIPCGAWRLILTLLDIFIVVFGHMQGLNPYTLSLTLIRKFCFIYLFVLFCFDTRLCSELTLALLSDQSWDQT